MLNHSSIPVEACQASLYWSAIISMAGERNATSPIQSPNDEEVCPDKFQDTGRASGLLDGIKDVYSSKRFADVIITVASREFECHKLLLSISSPFFMAMFSSDMQEGRQERIELREISPKTMELVLDYIYTGEVRFTEDTVQSLLSAANMFQLLTLRGGCAEFMMLHVTATNCIGVYFFAKAHQCTQLADKSRELINAKFSDLCHEVEFLLLPHDKLVQIVRDDAINVDREEVIYEACLAWLHYDLSDRRQHLLEVMKSVRFANISSYYFCDSIDSSALIAESEPLLKIISDVKYYHMLRNRYAEVDLNLVPRRGMAHERGVLIMANPYNDDQNRKFNTMEILLPRTGEIRHLCKLPQSVYMPGTCVTGDNQIYLAGGAIRKANYRGPFVSEGVTPNLFLFDKSFGSWQVKAKMHFGRSQFSLVLVDGLIYAMGGQNEHEYLDIVERYDPLTNQWTVLSPLPQKMRCMTSVGYRGKLYCFGGETSSEITKAVYRYDPTEDTWLELPSLVHARALAGCVVYKDTIYVIGGNSTISIKWKREFLPEHCLSSVEILDPNTSAWSIGPELPNALCGAGVVKFGDSIMVVGGEDDRSWMAGLFALKEENDKEFWVEGQELSGVMSTFGCGVANISKDLFRDGSPL